jgi:hypothetical protein
MLDPFRRWNTGKAYADQVKPFSFMLVATLDLIRIPDHDPVLTGSVVAPFASSAAEATIWFDKTGTPIDISVDAGSEVDDTVPVKSYARVFSDYLGHPEAKFLDHTGQPCGPDSTGVLHRTPVRANAWAIIGKEANEIDNVQAGYVSAKTVTNVYANDAAHRRTAAALQKLTGLSDRQLGTMIDRHHSTVSRYRSNELCPPDEIIDRLEHIAHRAGAA